ncbi:struthiocalcin-2-like [Alligator mississippiensis]|uniref:struthiocalcin-2-like n=1 Tax=Alligator mississippiensis TaxID=8496 RepID=UPI0028775826|nr:struthiocalcin-2-like [Alligator mississippiensis]
MGLVSGISLSLLGCLMLHLSLAGAQGSGCPQGWDNSDGGCYRYFSQELSWMRAETRCRRLGKGSHLASLHDKREHRAVAALVSRHQPHSDEDEDGDDVWIGFWLPAGDHRWQWTDGSAADYEAWHKDSSEDLYDDSDSDSDSDEVSPRKQLCVTLEEDSGYRTWGSTSCDDKNAFVCKLTA